MINARSHSKHAIDFSEICLNLLANIGHGYAELYAVERNYFKDKTKGNFIVEFFGLRINIYSFTVGDESESILDMMYSMDV